MSAAPPQAASSAPPGSARPPARAPGPLPGSPPYSHWSKVGGALTHARVYPARVDRPERAPLLLVVPGLGCASWMYGRLAQALRAVFTVWVYDHPGMGLSRGESWRTPSTLEHLTDHLAAWMGAAGLAGVPVLGHSLGGEVAIDLAARYPQLLSAALLCAPTGIPENPVVLAQLARLLQDVPRERPGLVLRATLSYARTGPYRLFALARNQRVHETGPLIGQVRCPAMVVDGSRDPVIRAWTLDVLNARLPSSHSCRIPGGTHALMDSHPQALARHVLQFWHRLPGEVKARRAPRQRGS